MDDLEIEERDCAVCLQKCHYPTQLPCGHIFCFLCVKGVALTNKKCAMCRAEIPSDYLNHPDVLNLAVQPAEVEHQWYYEGGNGWWKYEERHNSELELAYEAGESQCKLLIAGILYSVDFQKMMQYQIRNPARRRHVKRDVPMLPAKGIAGIKIEYPGTAKTESGGRANDNRVVTIANDGDATDSQSTDLPNRDRQALSRVVASIIRGIGSISFQDPRNGNSSNSGG